MELAWTIVGLIAGLSVLGFVELAKRYQLDWRAWTGLVLGELLILFCIAWCTASTAEGVPRSASMGLIMFGGLGLVTFILTWRLFIQGNEKPTGISSTTEDAAGHKTDDGPTEFGTDPETTGANRRQFFGQSLLQAIGGVTPNEDS